jgi:fructosamine-3-kinase
VTLPETLFAGISEAPLVSHHAVAGGSINDCFHLMLADGQAFFLKRNKAAAYPEMFEAEAKGLDLLKNAGASVPEVISLALDEQFRYLLLSWHPPEGETPESHAKAGEMLARLHKMENTHFGLDHDNYMGSVQQKNDRYTDFSDFWANCRIIPLVEKCRDLNYLNRSDTKNMEQLLIKTHSLVPKPKPSLIHGDLWSGNFHPSGGKIMLIDPAVAFSHPEADLAMMHLFGSPSKHFMQAYTDENAPEQGFRERFDFFNIYPLLIHLILFGEAYYAQLRDKVQKMS